MPWWIPVSWWQLWEVVRFEPGTQGTVRLAGHTEQIIEIHWSQKLLLRWGHDRFFPGPFPQGLLRVVKLQWPNQKRADSCWLHKAHCPFATTCSWSQMVSVYPSQSFCKAANQTYCEHVWGYIMLQYVTKGVPRWFSVVLGFTDSIWPSSIPRCLQQILVLAAFVAAPGDKSRANAAKLQAKPCSFSWIRTSDDIWPSLSPQPVQGWTPRFPPTTASTAPPGGFRADANMEANQNKTYHLLTYCTYQIKLACCLWACRL